jgi:hypothetical protein
MGIHKDIQLLKDIIRQLAELDKVVKGKLRVFLRGKNINEMKEVLRELDETSLNLLCEMSLPHEDYEICQAVHEVLDEKKEKGKGAGV